ncbi:hypothetical protein A6F68_02700 [Tsuneonella dongtanensis]|uniref:Uncharacterized protein n=1 Tax=Tsuneonella dongtanensis TaxID=692370 RepID=A0A1B2AGB9_9SPHN|nr:hypothetical protein [Tsuneonella dongtanensis]ANY21192.1 hypothetical protein A6F68_02700 [Tsuneonella dongtanensis]
MSQTFEFYDARAREAEAEADKATLDNVRDRNLRAAKTWQALANQAKRVMLDRAKTEREKAARRAVEAADAADIQDVIDAADEAA